MIKARIEAFRLLSARWRFRWNAVARRKLWQKLATMLNNAVPVTEAIDELRKRRIESKSRRCPQAIALSHWLYQMQNGNPLSVSIADWVSPEERMLVMAGERSGDMQKALTSISRVITGIREIRSAVVRGLAFPCLLLAASMALMYFFAVEIIPLFTASYEGHVWTGVAGLMVTMSNFVQRWSILVLLLITGAIAIFIYSLPRWDNRLRIVADRYIPYSIYRVMQGSSWLIAVSALVDASVSNQEAIEQLAKSAPPWLKTRLHDCLRLMRTGLNMGDALSKSVYSFPDPEIIYDLSIYAKFSGFQDALSILGNEWIDESVRQIQTRMIILKYVLIGLIGLLVMLMGVGSMELQFPTGFSLY